MLSWVGSALDGDSHCAVSRTVTALTALILHIPPRCKQDILFSCSGEEIKAPAHGLIHSDAGLYQSWDEKPSCPDTPPPLSLPPTPLQSSRGQSRAGNTG